MNSVDLWTRWSMSSLDDIEADLNNPAYADTAEQLLGFEEVAELQEAAHVRAVSGPREAVIFLPGFMGSLLLSTRGVTDLLWLNPALILKGKSRYLEIGADGLTDASPEIHAQPFTVEKLTYLKLGMALNRHTAYFEFPYDWRRPIESNGDLLKRFIDRWAADDPDRKFTLVGHSMGGLVSRAYMASHPQHAERHVKRLIMHGTPHYGAAGAVADIVFGNRLMAISSKLNSNNDVRQVMASLPSIYQLLPAPPELFPKGRPYPVNWDLYDATDWPREGVPQRYLDGGRAFHELLARADHQVELVEIAGCHLDTVVDVNRDMTLASTPPVAITRKEEGADSGDGTVPLWSVTPPGARVFYIEHIHRYLSRNKKVIEATLELIHDGTPDLPTELPAKEPGGLFGLFRGVEETPEEAAERLRVGVITGDLRGEDLDMLFMF